MTKFELFSRKYEERLDCKIVLSGEDLPNILRKVLEELSTDDRSSGLGKEARILLSDKEALEQLIIFLSSVILISSRDLLQVMLKDQLGQVKEDLTHWEEYLMTILTQKICMEVRQVQRVQPISPDETILKASETLNLEGRNTSEDLSKVLKILLTRITSNLLKKMLKNHLSLRLFPYVEVGTNLRHQPSSVCLHGYF